MNKQINSINLPVLTAKETSFIRDWQAGRLGMLHEWTCGNETCNGILVPVRAGTLCPLCGWRQSPEVVRSILLQVRPTVKK